MLTTNSFSKKFFTERFLIAGNFSGSSRNVFGYFKIPQIMHLLKSVHRPAHIPHMSRQKPSLYMC